MSAFTSEYVSLMMARNMFCTEKKTKLNVSFCVLRDTLGQKHQHKNQWVLTIRMKKIKKTKVLK